MYYVDPDIGQVWSNYKGDWLKPSTNNTGNYPVVNLLFEGKSYRFKLHELTAFVMFGRELIGMTCNHVNADKLEASSWNIELWTVKEQHVHAKKLGLKAKGETHAKANLNENKVRVIRKLHAHGMKRHTLTSFFHVTPSTIGGIIRNETWTHDTAQPQEISKEKIMEILKRRQERKNKQ